MMVFGGVFTIGVVVAVITEESDIDRCQQGEHEGLNKADEEFHEVEDEKETSAVEKILAAKDVSEKSNR